MAGFTKNDNTKNYSDSSTASLFCFKLAGMARAQTICSAWRVNRLLCHTPNFQDARRRKLYCVSVATADRRLLCGSTGDLLFTTGSNKKPANSLADVDLYPRFSNHGIVVYASLQPDQAGRQFRPQLDKCVAYNIFSGRDVRAASARHILLGKIRRRLIDYPDRCIVVVMPS